MVKETGTGSQQKINQAGRRRVLIVDDHAMMRQGLSFLVSLEPDLEIVGEAVDGLDAVERTRELKPDVVILDFSMPRMDGAEAARIIRAEFPDIRIVALSVYRRVDRAEAMIEAGADVYVEKDCLADNLISAVRG